ncbi:MAG TPA: protein translocase subunit SecF [Acidimicrobiales bacterium]|nr:protein translocase subunit SecF [Acidimicrobiales bacterium]
MSNDTGTFAPADPKTYGRFGRLYHGLTTVDFVGRRKVWFTVSIVIIVLGIGSLAIRGFNLGIDFKGGSSWEVLAPHTTIANMTSAVEKAGLTHPNVEKLGSKTYQITADLNALPASQQATITTDVVNAMAKTANVGANQVSTSNVGPTWGGQITNKALEALIVFFIAVVAYISIRFEPKMAVAAFIAMVHDLLVTVGVYSLFGFQITPDTVIAILTILGYSLYDTVVVFDRVRDNTQGVLKSGDLTYSDMVNLSMNQTLARSINTSLVAILPVLAVLLIGADLLGATTLQNYGLALFVGLMSGAYSSIFIASPLLAWMKEREPRYIDLAARVGARTDRRVLTATSAALQGAQTSATNARPARSGGVSGTIQARARKQKRR